MWRYFRQGRAVWKRSGIRLVQARWRANAAWFWGCGWRLGRPSDPVIVDFPGPASGLCRACVPDAVEAVAADVGLMRWFRRRAARWYGSGG
jgi:hypothetical protein